MILMEIMVSKDSSCHWPCFQRRIRKSEKNISLLPLQFFRLILIGCMKYFHTKLDARFFLERITDLAVGCMVTYKLKNGKTVPNRFKNITSDLN